MTIQKKRLRQPPQRCVGDPSPDRACVIGSDIRDSDYYDNIDGHVAHTEEMKNGFRKEILKPEVLVK